MANDIVVYGSSWCPFTVRVVRFLDSLDVSYHYIEVDDSPADERLIASWNQGRSIRPTLNVQGTVFVNPSPFLLRQELQERGLLPS